MSDFGGPEWDGFAIINGEFHHPYWRRPFTAPELLSQFYTLQKIPPLEHEVRTLRTELERAETALQAAEDRAAFYRRQLVLESRAGLMLAALNTTT